MTAIRTARERARAELTREIKEEARRQLAEVGSAQLSLRAVARALGMASSAVYRYFPSRDELLTALITDAYDSLGDAVEAADDPAAAPRERWSSLCAAVRSWAIERPHEYALLYGSPVPGYHAPPQTVAPGTRVVLRCALIAQDARPLRPAFPGPLDPALSAQMAAVAAATGLELAPEEAARVLIVWSQLFGLVGFELFGQFTGSADPAGPLFRHATDQMAVYLGLP
ncbi:TetR/AcrR family transcriptional regulator [Actinocorallia sp. A-T 12471]|uniref:TetR/AcrR family transcriptional regulator n=1 Tax=Actinocorallia sp. A-T 12471 TaxID=3089813 RepID=UPI0029D24F87|nr:TetR/AcrR family transcriptional regulator [Actinocorallia sp. A-T 12471]MDX6739686.1 TetR/AcrR family transcriptional regulator [Actinocorallia sp. A-T 12471]